MHFFPEGGYLIKSFINRVGFKVVGEDGKGIDISGTIVDNTGKILGEFRTSRFGLGMFKILPQQGRSYQASILYKAKDFTYKLPNALESGVVMNIIDKIGYYQVNLNSSLQNGIDKFRFIGRQRNQIMCDIKVSGNKGSILKVPKKLLEIGIGQFTLYDNNGRALCERLVFVEKNRISPKVIISSLKKVHKKGEPVELEISFDQRISKKLNANLSIAVSEKTVLQPYKYDLDIRSHLLLNSDLRGEIEQPGYYFDSDDPQRLKVLDMLMMTQGWRKYFYNDSIVQNNSAWTFPHETGIRFTGSVKKFNNINKSTIAEVSLIYSNSQETVYDLIKTDDQGRFTLGDYDFMDSTSIIIQAKSLKGRKDSMKNIKNPNMNFYVEMDSIILPSLINNTSTFSSYMEFDHSNNSMNTSDIDSIFGIQNGVIMLDEMIVESSKIKETSNIDQKKKLYREPSDHLSFDKLREEMPGKSFLSALDGRVPTLFRTIKTNPIFLLDGMPVTPGAIQSILIENVDYVDILTGPKAGIYGAGSVIAVYLLDGYDSISKTGNEERRGIINFVHPGYSQARKFYEPVYKTKGSEQNKIDILSTIYWNPAVNIDDQNNAKIRFNSTNDSTTYKVVIEGITSDGDVIRSESNIKIK